VILSRTATHCNTLHHTEPHCTTLHHTAPHCTTLQHTATHCNTLQHICPTNRSSSHPPTPTCVVCYTHYIACCFEYTDTRSIHARTRICTLNYLLWVMYVFVCVHTYAHYITCCAEYICVCVCTYTHYAHDIT